MVGALPAGTAEIGKVDIDDISSGTQTNDVKVTLDSEKMVVSDNEDLGVKDLDTGAGTDSQAVVGILLPKDGGAVSGGTSTDPIRTDPTGTTTQPVSATDLDIRDLTSASDSVEVKQATAANLKATVTQAGNVNIGDVSAGTQTNDVKVTLDTEKLKVDFALVKKTSSQDLSLAALAYTTNFAADTRVKQVLLHAASAITQTVSITYDSSTGATYDTKLDSTDISAGTDYFWTPDTEIVLASGDELLVGCTNSGTPAVTVYVSVIGETIE